MSENCKHANADKHCKKKRSNKIRSQHYRFMDAKGRLLAKIINVTNAQRSLTHDYFTYILESNILVFCTLALIAYLIGWIIFPLIYYLIAWSKDQLANDPNLRNNFFDLNGSQDHQMIDWSNKTNQWNSLEPHLQYNWNNELSSPYHMIYEKDYERFDYSVNPVCIHSHEDKRCYEHMGTISEFMTFYVETERKIGYGRKVITDFCASVQIVFTANCIYALLFDCVAASIIFIRLARPPKHTNHSQIKFGNFAEINKSSNGQFYLDVKVMNMKRSNLIKNRATIWFMEAVTSGKDGLDIYDSPLKLTEMTKRPQVRSTQILSHHINKKSPLWQFANADWDERRYFEILVFIEGTIESTGMAAQTRISYTANDIRLNNVCKDKVESAKKVLPGKEYKEILKHEEHLSVAKADWHEDSGYDSKDLLEQ